MELARKLAREMDEHRTVSVSRVYAPNEYSVWLSPQDRARYEGVEQEVLDELCAYLLEHARREELILVSPSADLFHTDERTGARGIRHPGPLGAPRGSRRGAPRARGARAPAGAGARPDDDLQHLEACGRPGRGGTCAARTGTRGARARRAPPDCCLPTGATIGRSRDCDIVLDDVGISRRHAEIRPGPDGWTVEDLGSTNGVLVNGLRVRGAQLLQPGRPPRAGLYRDHLRTRMTTLEPVSVALKFGFLAVLYLFLLWVVRSARKDLGGGRRAVRHRSRDPRPRHDPTRRHRPVLGLRARQRRRRQPGAAGWWSSALPATNPA